MSHAPRYIRYLCRRPREEEEAPKEAEAASAPKEEAAEEEDEDPGMPRARVGTEVTFGEVTLVSVRLLSDLLVGSPFSDPPSGDGPVNKVPARTSMVSSHNFNSQALKSRVSNPIFEYTEWCVKPW